VIHHFSFVPCTVVASRQRRRSRLHPVARNVKHLLGGDRDGVCGDRYRSQLCDHGGKDHLPQHGNDVFGGDRRADAEASAQHLPIRNRLEPAEPRAPFRRREHPHAAHNVGYRCGDRSSGHAQSCAPDGNLRCAELQRLRFVDQQEIERNVDGVHHKVDPHRRLRVTRRAQRGGKNDGGCAKKHGCADNEEIAFRVGSNGGVRSKPNRKKGTDRERQYRHHCSRDEHQQERLTRGALRAFLILRPQRLRNARQNAYPKRPKRRVDQPCGRGGQPDRRRRFRAQASDLRSIHILHQRLKRGFRYGGPRETEDPSP